MINECNEAVDGNSEKELFLKSGKMEYFEAD